ncbi:TraB/VirB10 family protein [Thiomicrolovo sp. ZZH C-3]
MAHDNHLDEIDDLEDGMDLHDTEGGEGQPHRRNRKDDALNAVGFLRGKIASTITSVKSFVSKKREERAQKATEEKVDFSKTNADLHEAMFGVLKRWFVYVVILGIVIILVIAAVRLYKKIGQQNEMAAQKETIVEPKVILEIEEEALWKDTMEKNVAAQSEQIHQVAERFDTLEQNVSAGFATLKEGLDGFEGRIIEQLDQERERARTEAKENKRMLLGKIEELDAKTSTAIKELPSSIKWDHGIKPGATVLPLPGKTGGPGTLPIPYEGVAAVSSEGNATAALPAQRQPEREEVYYADLEITSVTEDKSVDVQPDPEEEATPPEIVLRKGLMDGVLVTGISAPTFGEGEDNPKPVMVTLEANSIISNGFTQDLQGCFGNGVVTGNIITRRAEVQISDISCTYKENGKHYRIDTKLKNNAWVYDGYDGRFGIPGKLVDSSGKILTNSMLIGVLQGLGDFTTATANAMLLQSYQGAGATTIGDRTTVLSPGQLAQTQLMSGAGSGITKGFDVVTKYYEKIIDALHPYIDVKGARKITVYFDGDEVLTPKEYTPVNVNGHDEGNTMESFVELEVGYENW